jgi:hypothetical protein
MSIVCALTKAYTINFNKKITYSKKNYLYFFIHFAKLHDRFEIYQIWAQTATVMGHDG